jgi:hypothetical protein
MNGDDDRYMCPCDAHTVLTRACKVDNGSLRAAAGHEIDCYYVSVIIFHNHTKHPTLTHKKLNKRDNVSGTTRVRRYLGRRGYEGICDDDEGGDA